MLWKPLPKDVMEARGRNAGNRSVGSCWMGCPSFPRKLLSFWWLEHLVAGADPSVLSVILCSSLNTSYWLPLETRCWAARVFHLVCKGCFCDVMDPALPGWGSPVCGTSSMWLISNTVVEASGEKLPVPQLRTAEFVLLKACIEVTTQWEEWRCSTWRGLWDWTWQNIRAYPGWGPEWIWCEHKRRI